MFIRNYGVCSNFTEKGVHNNQISFSYQCIMNYSNNNIKYRYINLEESNSVYDAFFENLKLKEILGVKEKVESDLYGNKDIAIIDKKGYLLSTNTYNYEIVSGYSLQMYPYELNLINCIEGNDILLYNLEKKQKNNIKTKTELFYRYIFKLEFSSFERVKVLLKVCLIDIKNRVLRRVKRKK